MSCLTGSSPARPRYRELYGRETTSNNKVWLLRKINERLGTPFHADSPDYAPRPGREVGRVGPAPPEEEVPRTASGRPKRKAAENVSHVMARVKGELHDRDLAAALGARFRHAPVGDDAGARLDLDSIEAKRKKKDQRTTKGGPRAQDIDIILDSRGDMRAPLELPRMVLFDAIAQLLVTIATDEPVPPGAASGTPPTKTVDVFTFICQLAAQRTRVPGSRARTGVGAPSLEHSINQERLLATESGAETLEIVLQRGGGSSGGPRRGPVSNTSPYRGVTMYKRTGRWEAHIWADGKQIHLGSFSGPEEAARAYDRACIAFRGGKATTNFKAEDYEEDELLARFHQGFISKDELVKLSRAKQGGKPNPTLPEPPTGPNYRGVTCYKRTGKWEAHIWDDGKQIHLGSFVTPEEAAAVYDRAGIAFRGAKATTNFPAENYDKDELLLRFQMGLVSKDELVKLLRGCSLTGKRAPRAETRGVPAPPMRATGPLPLAGTHVPTPAELQLLLAGKPAPAPTEAQGVPPRTIAVPSGLGEMHMRCVNAQEENANHVKSRTFHGVRYDLTTSSWIALVPWAYAEHPTAPGKVIKYEYQGLFHQEQDAAYAHDYVALQVHQANAPQFVTLNFAT